MSQKAFIKLQSVSKKYQDVDVLKNMDISVDQGEILAIVGPSGSGKSTLLNIIGGLDRKYQGSVSVNGLNLKKLSDEQLSEFRNKIVGFVFQQFHLLEHMTCKENIRLPLLFSNKNLDDSNDRVAQVLEKVGLEKRGEQKVSELSGGQKQRVALARAIFNKPLLLLCDEPTGNLDKETGNQIIELFKQLNKEGITFVVVTHESRISDVATRVLKLDQGELFDE